MKVNLKGWIKTKDHEDHALFKNSQGHELKIAKKPLSPKMRGELAALPMAEGGNPKLEESKKLPAKPKMLAEGGDVSQDDQPQQPATVNINVGGGGGGGQPQIPSQFINPEAGAPPPGAVTPAAPSSPDIYGVNPEEQAKMRMQQAATAMPTQQASAGASTPPQASPVAVAPQPGQPTAGEVPSPQQPPSMMGGYQKEMAGFNAEANAEGQEGKEQAAALQNQVVKQQNAAQQYQSNYNSLEQERQAFMSDLQKQHIDPNHYVGSKDTIGKVSTAIGLILGGMGGGLLGQENPALKFLNAQIDRDIEAQKVNMGNTHNLLSANLHQFGNMRDAADMTRVMQSDIIANQLKMAAAKAQDPMAKARALKAAGQLEMSAAPTFQQLAMRQTLMNGGGELTKADPATFVPWVVPEPHQKTALSEIERAQNTRKMAGNIMKSFEDAVKENTVMKTGAGMLRTPGSVLALHQHMQPTFQDLEGTVRQAAMDNTFNNITPKPGDSTHTIAQKRQAIQEYLKAKQSAPTAKAFGLDLDKFQTTSANPAMSLSPQQQGFLKWAQENPNDPRSAHVLKKLGIQ